MRGKRGKSISVFQLLTGYQEQRFLEHCYSPLLHLASYYSEQLASRRTCAHQVVDSAADKVEALDAGADDHVTKPFGISELLARVRAVLRRTVDSPPYPATHLRLGAVEIDFEGRYVLVGDERVRLTPKELDLLSYLTTHSNRTITHRELLQAVWGPEHGHDPQYLHVFMNRLRNKIERSPKHPKFLITEPWVGYRLQLAD